MHSQEKNIESVSQKEKWNWQESMSEILPIFECNITSDVDPKSPSKWEELVCILDQKQPLLVGGKQGHD